MTLNTFGIETSWCAAKIVKLAPLTNASLANSKPILPEDLLEIPLIGSISSKVPPKLINMFFPAILDTTPPAMPLLTLSKLTALTDSRTMSSIAGNLAFPSSMRGLTNLMPSSFSFSTFSLTASYMESCIEGTKTIGVSWPWAVIKRVFTGLSEILYANLEMVFAVAGATKIKSCWEYFTCSIFPVNSNTTSWPVANSKALGWIILVASLVMNALTEWPCLLNSLANLMVSVAAILPVTHKTISIKSLQ